MDSRWLKHLPEAERKDYKSYLLNSAEVFNRLSVIVKTMLKKEKRDDYKEAGWPYLRAYDDGYNAAMKDVQDLITFKED